MSLLLRRRRFPSQGEDAAVKSLDDFGYELRRCPTENAEDGEDEDRGAQFQMIRWAVFGLIA